MKRWPCSFPKPVLWELNSFLMQTLSFVTINLHRCWLREWKHRITTVNKKKKEHIELREQMWFIVDATITQNQQNPQWLTTINILDFIKWCLELKGHTRFDWIRSSWFVQCFWHSADVNSTRSDKDRIPVLTYHNKRNTASITFKIQLKITFMIPWILPKNKYTLQLFPISHDLKQWQIKRKITLHAISHCTEIYGYVGNYYFFRFVLSDMLGERKYRRFELQFFYAQGAFRLRQCPYFQHGL